LIDILYVFLIVYLAFAGLTLEIIKDYLERVCNSIAAFHNTGFYGLYPSS
jgi:hypothetical protein